MKRCRLPFSYLILALALILHADAALRAQGGARPSAEYQSGVAGPDLMKDLGGLGGFGDFGGARELTLSGQLTVGQGGRHGVLEIVAKLAPHWHTYAIEQQGGPGPSKITVQAEGQLELLGPFRPDRAPKQRQVEVFDVPLLEHYGEVKWSAPVCLAEGVDPEKLDLDVKFDGQVCDDKTGCKPISGERIPVRFGGYVAPIAAPLVTPVPPSAAKPAANTTGKYRAERSHVTVFGTLVAGNAAPGGRLTLTLTAVCDPGFHVYAYAPQDPAEIAKPTLIVLGEPPGWSLGNAKASSTPTVKNAIAGEPPVRYHVGEVTWIVDVQVPAGATPGAYNLTGWIGYQTCTDNSCDPPTAARFSATVEIGGGVAAQSQPLAFAAARYSEAAEQATRTVPPSTVASDGLDLDRLQVQTSTPTRPMLVILGIAFLGGLILNVMPCVLPVIGLKVMSFAQQAGESRARVFALNLWYSLGLVSVFLVLATLAVVWKLGWGEQFNSDQFNIVMVSVVFTMGLSFLGVWEIPIPGFVGGGKASELAEKEGPTGAFVKGVVTTLLATPCSGPGLATALTWCSNKPAPLVYLVFTVMGLGMASPYLLIGANPKLVRLLPKPGAWMDTLKQTMGFILLGTVVYMLTFVRWANVLPTLALLFGLWAACWWIGRTPITEEFQVRLRAWGVAIVFAFVIGLFAFGEQFLLGDYTVYGLRGIMEHRLTEFVDKRVQDRLEDQGAVAREAPPPEPRDRGFELPWEPFSTVKLKQLADGGKTVLVDFTAKWCLTCKFLEHTVLNTKEVRQAVDENGVVTLIADWTDRDPEMGRLLEALGSKQVPVVAIFPAGKPNQPIVLLGGYTQQTLLAKLREAGPSQATAKSAGRDHSFRSTIRPMRQLGSPASSNVRWMLSA